MTPEDHIDAVLQHLAGGRVFPDLAPPGTGRPFITYQLVGGTPDEYLSGDRAEKRYRRFQVNVWAARRAEASDLGMLAEDALRSATYLQVEVLTERAATYDEDTDLRGFMQDFNLYC